MGGAAYTTAVQRNLALEAIVVAALAALYIACAKLGLAFAFRAAQVTTVWPATGSALFAVYRFRRSRARLIAGTGYGQSDDEERFRAAGIDHHLLEPIERHALAAIIDARQQLESRDQFRMIGQPRHLMLRSSRVVCHCRPPRTRDYEMQSDVLPVLIVEDDEPTQNLLQAVLRRWGYASEIASNGREAIASLERADFSTIVLDMMMPSVGGQEVIDFVSASSRPTPIIICSAAGPATFEDIDPRVVKAIVRKPFNIDDVIEAINRVTRPTVS